jgi:hypothetical protein
MAIDNYIVGDETLPPLTILPSNPDELPTKKRSSASSDDERPDGEVNLSSGFGKRLPANLDQLSTKKRSSDSSRAVHLDDAVDVSSNSTGQSVKSKRLTATSHLITQINAADNLNWISAFSRQGNLEGPYYNFEDFTYDDGENLSLINPTWVYYVDGSGFAIHSVSIPFYIALSVLTTDRHRTMPTGLGCTQQLTPVMPARVQLVLPLSQVMVQAWLHVPQDYTPARQRTPRLGLCDSSQIVRDTRPLAPPCLPLIRSLRTHKR